MESDKSKRRKEHRVQLPHLLPDEGKGGYVTDFGGRTPLVRALKALRQLATPTHTNS